MDLIFQFLDEYFWWIFLAAAAYQLIRRVLFRFRASESAEMRELDAQVWAIEKGFDFSKQGDQFFQYLNQINGNLDKKRGVISNVIRQKESPDRKSFFEYKAMVEETGLDGKKVLKARFFKGIAVHFQQKRFPNCHLSQSDLFFDPGEIYIRINRSLNPDWLPESIQVCTRGYPAKEIVAFIDSEEGLQELLVTTNFSALVFRGYDVVLYLDSSRNQNNANLDQLDQIADLIGSLKGFGPSNDPEVEIKMLKRDEPK